MWNSIVICFVALLFHSKQAVFQWLENQDYALRWLCSSRWPLLSCIVDLLFSLLQSCYTEYGTHLTTLTVGLVRSSWWAPLTRSRSGAFSLLATWTFLRIDNILLVVKWTVTSACGNQRFISQFFLRSFSSFILDRCLLLDLGVLSNMLLSAQLVYGRCYCME